MCRLNGSDNVTRISSPHLQVQTEVGVQLVVNVGIQQYTELVLEELWEQQLPSLPDGFYQVTAAATDLAGNISQTDSAITIDTVAPTAATLDLALTSDTGLLGDHQTGATRVTLVGTTEGSSFVTLDGVAPAVRSAGDGKFRVPNIVLASGLNNFLAHVVDLAGNVGPDSEVTFTRIVEAGVTDPVIGWNVAALEAVRLDASNPLVATRNLAMVSLAMVDVVSALEGTPSFLVQLSPPVGASPEAAASSAAFEVLKYAYPAQESSLQAVLNSALAEIPDGQAKVDGVSFGQSLAQAIIALRSGDGWNTFVDYTPSGIGAGIWQETAPMYAPALLPQWGDLQTFAIASADALVPGGPPSLASTAYGSAMQEVASLGRATGSTRTADQTQIARFWADGPGTTTPPGHWNAIAGQVAQSAGNSWGENARLFAELNAALGDAAIVAWNAKYTYEFWRPIAAIQQADLDGNAQTTADPAWSPLLITPPFPEYVSGHSTFSAAAARVLTAEFGPSVDFTISSPGLPGVERSFTSFDQAAAEAGRSRIYGGIHFEFANQDGQAAGRAVADEVLDRFSFANDVLPPKIVLTSPLPGLASNTSPTIQGWVIDNLSGVRDLQAAVDGETFAAVNFDSAGRFSFQPQLALDGSDDGSHVVHFRAVDFAALASAVTDFAFTLDTAAPTIVITGLTAGAQINGGTLLAGTAHGTGSQITALSYQIDAGLVMPLAFDNSTGSFGQLMDLSKVATGAHTVTVIARDAAGLTAIESVSVQLAAAIPFVITSLNPVAGAIDIGTTVRPQVFFSRPVSVSSLAAANLYATGPDGAKLPATIVPAADGSFAWLFFADPMPGGSLITLHVDGATILAAADGTPLDADGDGDGDGGSGGLSETTFRTVSLAPLLGTSLSGRVLDPGPDLFPMTFDDIRAGADQTLHTPDDVFLRPLAGVTVFILGLENQAVLTDAAGNFHFDAVPAGNVKLALDGRTATNVPAGFYFPEMVMDLTLRAGQTNTAMGTMGTPDQQLANADRQEVYLPRLRTDILRALSATEPTVVTVDPASAPGLTPEQRSRLTITVPPGSLIGHDGQPVAGGLVGISTVPPELVRDMLPPGLLQHTFDITIQAPGIDRFTTPVPMTFPNLMGAAPGSQVNFLSFDHATGRLVIEGTMTVSPDGLTASTDPGQGITHPGWHGAMPQGTQSGPSCPPPIIQLVGKPPTDVPPIPRTLGIRDYFFPGDDGAMTFSFANAAELLHPGLDPCDPINAVATPLVVYITYHGIADEFLEGLSEQTFTLHPGQQRHIRVEVKDLLLPSAIVSAVENTLFGVKVIITAKQEGKTDLLIDKEIYAYRFLDVLDDDHTDGQIDFEKTLSDSNGGALQEKLLSLQMDQSGWPTFDAEIGFHFPVLDGVSQQQRVFQFDPLSVGEKTDTMQLITPAGNANGSIVTRGKAVGKQIVLLPKASFQTELTRLVDDLGSSFAGIPRLFPSDGPDDGKFLSDEPGFQPALDSIYNDVVTKIAANFSAVSPQVGLALSILPGATGPGQLASFHNVKFEPAGKNPCGKVDTPACAWWVDFDRDDFGVRPLTQLNSIVARVAETSNMQRKWLFDSITNTSYSDDEGGGRENTLRFNLDVIATLVQDAPNQFTTFLANVITHEVGHNLGAIHHRTYAEPYIEGDLSDAMGATTSALAQSFTTLAPVVKLALGVPVTDTEFGKLFTYYRTYEPWETYDHNVGLLPPRSHGDDALFGEPILSAFAALLVVGEPLPDVVENIDFPTTFVDGLGGAVSTVDVILFNNGGAPLNLAEVRLLGGNPAFSIVGGDSVPLTLPSIDPDQPEPDRSSHRITVRFDPAAVGEVADVLRIESNRADGIPLDIPLRGFGVSPFGDIQVDMSNNNLGGKLVDGGSPSVSRPATIRNTGADTLHVTQVRVAAGRGQGEFAVGGLPLDLSLSQPLMIAPGESFTFMVAFDPGATGLRPGVIEIVSNDPETPLFRQGVIGTGLADLGSALDYGNDFVALETHLLPGAPVFRQRSDEGGNWSFFLPPNEAIHHVVFDPQSGLISHAYDVTAPSGQNTPILAPMFFASTAPDSDGDGLPDDVEFAVGTGLSNVDTDNDGLSDFVEIAQGLDPLGGLGLPTGVVAAATLRGEAHELVLEGSITNTTAQTAYVATGNYGLAILDLTLPTTPIILSEVNLSGVSTDVAVDAARKLAVLAAGSAGIHIVDVSNPALPTLVKTVQVEGGVSRVEVFDGLAYVAAGNAVVSIDLVTHEVRQTLPVGQPFLTGLAVEGNTLYTLDAGTTLRAIMLDGPVMVLRGSVALPGATGQVFVGNGIAYAPVSNSDLTGFVFGFVTADVRDPANLTLISGSDLPPNVPAPGMDFAATGSGLGLLIGNIPNQVPELRFNALDVMVVADPANTNSFVTRILLPGLPRGVGIASGLSFIADDASGLQVVSFQPLDTQGQAPAITIAASGNDRDPVAPGVQVRGGETIHVPADVLDDVLVRNVELLVNGQVVRNDVSFPWSLLATAPVVNEPTFLLIQARATDTGGNTGLSNLLTVEVLPDLFAPALVATSPSEGQVAPSVEAIDLFFDEGLDGNLLDAAGVALTNLGPDGLPGGGDDAAVAIDELVLSGQGLILTIVPAAELTAGVHRLVVDAAILADAAGNHVAAPVELSFIVSLANSLIAASGDPTDPELPSANPGQEISFVMPWGPEAARISFPTINIDGLRTTEGAWEAPSRTDPATRTAYFIVPDTAVTGDITVFGGAAHGVSALPNWTFVGGSVNLFGQDITGFAVRDRLPGNGLYLAGISYNSSIPLESKALFDLAPGNYELRFDLSGSTVVGNITVTVSLGDEFMETFGRPINSPFATFTRIIQVTSPGTARLVFSNFASNPNLNVGPLLDNVKLTRIDSGEVLLDDHFDLPFPDGTFPLQIVPILSGVDVTSAQSDGSSAAVTLHGAGFIEGENTSYQFGSVAVVDSEISAGADVVNHLDPFAIAGGFTGANGGANLTLPLSPAAFGSISVTTAGGRSAPFTAGVSAIIGTAASGTPADPAIPSANPGQAITLVGAGLTTATDIIVRYTDGALTTRLLNPTLADLDGSSAQVILPASVNGIVQISIFGSPAALPVQIVPVIEQGIVIFRSQPLGGPFTRLIGRGFVDGDSEYDIDGTKIFDAGVADSAIAVMEANTTVELNFAIPADALVQVTTPGGTSAAILANVSRPPERPAPTITGIVSLAADGVPANPADDSANTGQVITIQGVNFGLDNLQVLFPTRNESGVKSVLGVVPLAVNEAGTLVQVRVPDLAETGLLRVTNVGSRNLGFGDANDAIHRDIELEFTPAGGTVELRFADGGLSELSDESWGLDNVRITRDATAIFSDDFQGALRPEWSVATTAETPLLGSFSGPLGNSVQKLTLTGLTAGAPHTLRFDLYVLDTWDGLAASPGPDRFLVRADAETLFDESFSNNQQATQTFAPAEGMLLQIIPTITWARPHGRGYASGLDVLGSGFMEAAGTITIGGLAVQDDFSNGVPPTGYDDPSLPNVVADSGNKDYDLPGTLFTLDSPIRVTTAGGYFEAPGLTFRHAAPISITSIQATAAHGIPLDPSLPSANTGQEITLTGSFRSPNGGLGDNQLQFDAVDDSGMAGTITSTGQTGLDSHHRLLTVTVPETARTGMVRALGSPGEFFLQIVPTLRGVGPVIAGVETVLEGTGLLRGDLALSVDGRPVAGYAVDTVRSIFESHELPDRQFVRFTVPDGIGPGLVRAVTSGGSATLQPRVAQAATNLTPDGDVGDTIGAALAVATVTNSRLIIDSDLEARSSPNWDSDFYQFNFQAGERLAIDLATTSSSIDFKRGYWQLFNFAGRAVPYDYWARDSVEDHTEYTAPYTGVYFLEVGDNYLDLPAERYQLHVRRLAADASILTGIATTAGSGTPAHAALGSANTGQVITLTGSGLQSAEQVVFTADVDLDTQEIVVAPLAVAADGSSLTVRVPDDAVSGVVRLSAEAVGVFLQIVPTVDRFNVGGAFRGEGSGNILGSGFDVPATLYFGSVAFEFPAHVNQIGLDPAGVPFGPLSITTPGGTSAPLAGPDLIAVVALAASGVPANASLPSANPGQTITLEGSRFEAAQVFVRPATPIVFQVIDAAGNRRERRVTPTTVDPAGTQMTIIVPADAVTGPIGVIGDPQGTAIVLQIVPLATSVMATEPGVVQVSGKGLIEGGALYRFGINEVLDGSISTAGVDVIGANDSANIALPALGNGMLTVTTAGGTSAPLPFGALLAAGASPANHVAPVDLTPEVLQAHVAEAVARFAAAGVPPERLSGARTVAWQVSELPDNYLGLFAYNTILLDRNASGWGWFVDATPGDDSEFALPGNQGEQDRMDLLTVVMHELGHVLGRDHDADGVMAETLAAGARRTDLEHDDVARVDQVLGQANDQRDLAWLGAWLNEQFDSIYGRAKRRR